MKDGETFSDRFFDFSEDDCSRQEKSTTMVMQFSIGGGGGGGSGRLDFRRHPGPVFDLPRRDL